MPLLVVILGRNNNNNNKVVPFHAMKAYWGEEVYLHSFLSSAPDGDEWSTSLPGRFIPEKESLYTLSIKTQNLY
jgi:hypothetical protein